MLHLAHNESFEAASALDLAKIRRSQATTTAFATAFVLLLALALFALPGCNGNSGNANAETEAINKANVGEVVQFGNQQWRVLAKENGQALIITEDVIDVRGFNENRDATTWETCSLRAYLNGEFCDGFSDDQKKAIVETKNANPANPDFGTPSGNETTDKVFLLSLDEANKYFDSDDARIANLDGKAYSWWLRTMGSDDYIVAYVGTGGDASRSGHFADYTADGYGGVRPAMWVKI